MEHMDIIGQDNEAIEMIESGIIKAKEERDKYIYDNPTFPVLYHLSGHRENIVSWLPFQGDEIVLELGAESGAITEYLSNHAKKVIAVEENADMRKLNFLRNSAKDITIVPKLNESILELYSGKINYIIITSYLDTKKEQYEILKMAYNLLAPTGKLILSGFNRFGLKNFSGNKDCYTKELFSNMERTNEKVGINKKKVLTILKKIGFKSIKTYYPYPDHLFLESLYSDEYLPNVGDLHNNARNFEADSVVFFDETKAFDTLIMEDMFVEMANSFLFIAQKESINEIDSVYTKFSKERELKYQIQTTIHKGEKFKYVTKKSFNQDLKHLKKIYDFYVLNKDVMSQQNINYCNVEMTSDSLIFDYINGKTLEQIIMKHVKEEDIDAVYKDIEIIKRAIYSQKETAFVYTEQFINIFGKEDGLSLEGVAAIENPNLDLITGNILINTGINIIDYEWIFDFPVPANFILFRSLFHSLAISRLPETEIAKLFDMHGITKEHYDFYFRMENKLQEHISGPENKLSTILSRIGTVKVKLENNYLERSIQELKLIGAEKTLTNPYHYTHKFFQTNEINVEIMLDKNINNYILIPMEKKGIIDIRKLHGIREGEVEEIEIMSSNAVLVKGTTFYFDTAPKLFFKNQLYDSIVINVFYFHIGNDCVDSIIELSNQNRELKAELGNFNGNIFVRILKKIKAIK